MLAPAPVSRVFPVCSTGSLGATSTANRNTASVPKKGGTGVEQSTEGQGATNKDTETLPGESSKAGDPTGKEPGTGVEDSVQGEGATAKQGMDDTKEGKAGTDMGGAPTGNALGGTGVEGSAESEGSKDKTSN
jgi:hypothetical protein